MLNKTLTTLNSYLHFAVVRALLFFAIFIGLGLATQWMAALMYLDWHWTLGSIAAACLGPWAFAILVLILLTALYGTKFHSKKKKLCELFTASGFFSSVFSFFLGSLLKRGLFSKSSAK